METVELNKCTWYQKEKLGETIHFSEIICRSKWLKCLSRVNFFKMAACHFQKGNTAFQYSKSKEKVLRNTEQLNQWKSVVL